MSEQVSLLILVERVSCQVSTTPVIVPKCVQQESIDWDREAANVCPADPKWYHCLQDESGKFIFYEFCRQYIFVTGGTYPTYSSSKDEIHPKECPEGTFQFGRRKSSSINRCTDKIPCNEFGQQICDEGSKTEDRLCKCDYKQGLAIAAYGDNPSSAKVCCPINNPSCQCFPKNCPADEELNEIYQCMKKCPDGYYRPSKDEDCKLISTPPTTITPVVKSGTPSISHFSNSSTTTSISSSVTPPTSPTDLNTTVFIGVGAAVALLLIIFLVVILLYCCFRDKFDSCMDWMCCVSRKVIKLKNRENEGGCCDCLHFAKLKHPDREITVNPNDRPPRRRHSSITEVLVTLKCCGLCREVEPHKRRGSYRAIYGPDQTDGVVLRKEEDSTIDMNWMKKIVEGQVDQRIGKITVDKSYGTGFRAGDIYVVSAYHIFENKIESLWERLVTHITDCETDLQHCASCLNQTDPPKGQRLSYDIMENMVNRWKKQHENMVTFRELIETGIFGSKDKVSEVEKDIVDEWDAKIKFGYLEEKSTDKEYKLDPDIAYQNKEKDIIVLKLIKNKNGSIPPPFVLETGSSISPMHLFGHPDGKTLQLDPKCEVYVQDKEEKLKQDTDKALTYCEKHHKDWCTDKKCDGNDLNRLKNEYEGLYKLCDGNVVFHCSKSIIHGASGSPGIITQPGLDLSNPHAFKVQAMLLSGHPKTLYAAITSREERNKLKQKMFFEKGISMKTVHDILACVPDLRNNLFRTDVNHMSVAGNGKEEKENTQKTENPSNNSSSSQPSIVKHETNYYVENYTVIQDSKNIASGKKAKFVLTDKVKEGTDEFDDISHSVETEDEKVSVEHPLKEMKIPAVPPPDIENKKPTQGKRVRYKNGGKYSLVRQDAGSESEDGSEKEKEPMDLLRENVKKQGLKFRPETPGDGNCFFHAVSDQLKRLSLPEKDHTELRKEIVDYLRGLPDGKIEEDSLGSFVEGEGTPQQRWNRYLQNMSSDGTYADELVVKYMAEMLNRMITVITSSPDGSKYDEIERLYNENARSKGPPLLLGHVHENHYVSLDKNS